MRVGERGGGGGETGGCNPHLDLILRHGRDAVVIKVVPLTAVLVAGERGVCNRGRSPASSAALRGLGSVQGPLSLLPPRCPRRPVHTLRSPPGVPRPPTPGVCPCHPRAPTVSVTQAPVMVGNRDEIVFVQLWGRLVLRLDDELREVQVPGGGETGLSRVTSAPFPPPLPCQPPRDQTGWETPQECPASRGRTWCRRSASGG